MLKYKDYSTLVNEQQKEYESFTKDKMFLDRMTSPDAL